MPGRIVPAQLGSHTAWRLFSAKRIHTPWSTLLLFRPCSPRAAPKYHATAHTWNAPAQQWGASRRYELGEGVVNTMSAGRCCSTPAKKASPSGHSPCTAGEPLPGGGAAVPAAAAAGAASWASRFTSPRHSEKWQCRPLAASSGNSFGRNDATRSCLAATAETASRAKSKLSAACSAGVWLSASSNWPGPGRWVEGWREAYSSCNQAAVRLDETWRQRAWPGCAGGNQSSPSWAAHLTRSAAGQLCCQVPPAWRTSRQALHRLARNAFAGEVQVGIKRELLASTDQSIQPSYVSQIATQPAMQVPPVAAPSMPPAPE